MAAKMWPRLSLVLLALLAAADVLAAEPKRTPSTTTAVLPVYHTTTPAGATLPPAAPWTLRGHLRIPPLRTGSATYTSVESFDKAVLAALTEPANATALYQVAVALHPSAADAAISLSSVRLCALQTANFADRFDVHSDARGAVAHVAYAAATAECAPRTGAHKGDVEFETVVHTSGAEEGPRPNVHEAVSLPPRGPNGEKPGEEQSFFQKYWYWIVGGLIIYSLTNVMGPPPPAAAAGGAPASGGARPAVGR